MANGIETGANAPGHLPRWFAALRSFVCIVLLLLTLFWLAACYFSELWSEAVPESTERTIAHTGWTVFMFLGVVVSAIRHRDEGKNLSEIPSRVMEFFKSPEFYVPVIYAWVFFLALAVFIVPARKFQEQNQIIGQLRKRMHADPSDYNSTPAQQLAEERKGRIQAEAERDEYRKRGLEWLLASNSSPTLSVLDDAIQIVTRERSHVTNDSVRALQFERDLASLEQKKKIELTKVGLTPLHNLWTYAASKLRALLVGPATKCGADIEIITLPTIDEIASGHSYAKTEQLIASGTNCQWTCSYRVQSRVLIIAFRSAKSQSARAQFRDSGRTFQAQLLIEDEPMIPKQCAISDTTNCLANVDSVLELLFASQRAGFQ